MTRTAVLVGVLAVFAVVLLLAAPTGGPVRVSYVETDSMAPALEPGDAYVLVPPGQIEPGDIVTFWAPSRGEFVTHRVVGETDEGYVTRGDANDATDQAAGYAPVSREAVVGELLTVAGTPVVIPGVGTVVPLVTRYRLVLFAAVLLAGTALVTRAWKERSDDRPGRPVYRVRDVVRPLFVVCILASIAVTPLGAESYRLSYVVGEAGSGEPVTVGESTSRTVSLDVEGARFVRFVATGEGLAVDEVDASGRRIDLQVTIPPPESPGVEQAVIRVYAYPAVLPDGWLVWLHGVHPLAAILTSVGVVFGPLFAGYRLFVDGSRPVPSPWTGATRRAGP